MSTSSSSLPSGPRGLERFLALAAAQPLAPACDRFYFLRHGQTPRNALKIFQDGDEPLSEAGIAQAHAAGELLAGEPLAALVHSDMARAHHTARIVGAHHGFALQPHAGLRERHFGELIGTSSAAIDWNCAPANGETLETFVQRTRAALADALARPGPVLVVAHGGTLYALAALLGAPLGMGLLANAHPLRFERGDGGWQAVPLAAAPAQGVAGLA